MGFLRGVPLLRPHPAAVWMGIAPSQSDARYPYGHTLSLKVNAPGICRSNFDRHTRSYEKCQFGTFHQVPNLGTCPFSKYNHRHRLLHKYPGIRLQKCARVSKNFLGFLSPLPIPRQKKCKMFLSVQNFFNNFILPLWNRFLPIVGPMSHPICRLQGLFTALVFPRRYCSVGAHDAALLPGRGIFVPVC